MNAITTRQSLSLVGEPSSPNVRPNAANGPTPAFVLDSVAPPPRSSSQKPYSSDPIDVLWTEVEGEESEATDSAAQAFKRRGGAGGAAAFGPVDRYVRTQSNGSVDPKGAFVDVRA